MDPLSAINEELAEIDCQIADVFPVLSNRFQKVEKIKDSNRQSQQLEDLTDKMWDCKRDLLHTKKRRDDIFEHLMAALGDYECSSRTRVRRQ